MIRAAGGGHGRPSAEVTAPEDAEPASAALLNGIYTARGRLARSALLSGVAEGVDLRHRS